MANLAFTWDPAKAMAEGVETKEAVKRVKKAPPKPPAKK